MSAEPNQLPVIVKELDANPEVAATYLSPLLAANATTVDEKRAQLHARLALVSRDRALVEPLLEELLTNKVVYVGPIRQQLRPYAGELTEKLRAILRDEKAEANRRFRAAVALADYVPESEAASWSEQDLKFVAEQLVSSNAEFQPLLRDALRPIRARLLGDLERIFADAKATVAQQLSAANAFADYAAGDIPKLSQLLAVATPEQYAVLYPIVAASPAPATIEDLAKIAATPPSVELGSVQRIPYGQRRANAAVTLLRLGEREKVLPVFDMSDDPEALTQFIFRCRPRGVAVDALLDCLQRVSVAPKDRYPKNTRYALLLSLGEFSLEEIPESRRVALLEQLADWYRHDPSSGVHGAAGWLLRQWGQAEVARQVDHTAVPYSPDREWFTLAITVTPTAPPKPKTEPAKENAGSKSEPRKPAESRQSKPDETAKPAASSKSAAPAEKAKLEPPALPLPTKTFYYTFIVFPAGAYDIGSVNDEPDRQKNEVRHSVTLTRPFALLDREITVEELIAFSPHIRGIHAAIRCETRGCRVRCGLVRRGGLLPVAGPAVGLVGRRPVVCGSGDAGQGEVSARTESRGELGPAELAAGAGSTGISIADGIGVGSGQPCRSADALRLWQRGEPAGTIWLVRGEQWQASRQARRSGRIGLGTSEGFADESRYSPPLPLHQSGHDRRNRVPDPLDLWRRGGHPQPRHRSDNPSGLDRRLAAIARSRRPPVALQFAVRQSRLRQKIGLPAEWP